MALWPSRSESNAAARSGPAGGSRAGKGYWDPAWRTRAADVEPLKTPPPTDAGGDPSSRAQDAGELFGTEQIGPGEATPSTVKATPVPNEAGVRVVAAERAKRRVDSREKWDSAWQGATEATAIPTPAPTTRSRGRPTTRWYTSWALFPVRPSREETSDITRALTGLGRFAYSRARG